MTTIKDIIEQSGIVKQEVVLLIAHVLRKPKEYVIAHDDSQLTNRQVRKINKLIQRRQNNEPIAYLIGEKEFYGRNFRVNKSVLIPRPETETIIDVIKRIAKENDTVIDIGTGSGCIAITLKLENPNLNVTASDISKKALKTAKENAENLNADVKFVKSDLLKNVRNYTKYDIITANLPYVDEKWKTGEEIKFEPKTALFADGNGLEIVKQLVEQAKDYIKPGGFLVLELDPCQHKEIVKFAENFGFLKVKTDDYIVILKYS